MAEDQYNIALWGPTSSGKTWFIRAFARKMKQDFYRNDPDFRYEIKDYMTGFPIDTTPPNISGTKGNEDSTWVFERVPKQKTDKHTISAYRHLINVRDDRGSATIDISGNDTSRINILTSDYLLVMLDPQKLKTAETAKTEKSLQDTSSNEQSDPTLGGEEDYWSQAEYIKNIRILFETLLTDESRQHYYVAVCVTKVDWLGIRNREPMDIIKMYFGNDMHTLLQDYSAHNKISLKTFATSAFGFLKGEEKATPNNAEGHLKNPDRWEPYKVEEPLFWLFETVERQNLKSKHSGKIVSIIFHPDREKLYIPYRTQKY